MLEGDIKKEQDPMNLLNFIKEHAAVLITSILSAIAGIIIASNTSFFQAKTDFSNSVMLEVMQQRIKTYPEVYKVTLELSKYRPEPLTVEEGNALGHKINTWLYGRGGLFANCLTRQVVGEIRKKLIRARTKEDLDAARKLRSKLIHALRADIGLMGDLGSNSQDQLFRNAINEQIERIKTGSVDSCTSSSKEAAKWLTGK